MYWFQFVPFNYITRPLLILLMLALAYPGAIRKQGIRKFILSYLISLLKLIFGILVPIFYFFMSCLIGPEWKGEASSPYSCLIVTKYLLGPLALWAWVSFYAVQVVMVTKVRSWMTLGLFTGVMGSICCALTLCFFPKFLIRNSNTSESFIIYLYLIPVIYLPVWYGYAFYRASKACPQRLVSYAAAFSVQTRFWFWAAKKSEEFYWALPDQRPSCYLVTASTYGYPWLVNQNQLLRFSEFEKHWLENAPRSHKLFRKFYNIVGPVLARLICNRVLASLSYLALKPAEWMIVALVPKGESASVRSKTL